jgi:pimeloyl-ACP methyl ester carboxylesterase
MNEAEKTLCVTGLRHHVIEWPAVSELPPIVLLHGWMDSAASFRDVALALQASGRRVLALDLRGYGDTEYIHEQATYYFTDYVRDVIEVLDALGLDRIDLVGHSMGGTIATLVAGAFPERVRRLVLIEGLGPGTTDPSDAPARTRRWIDSMKRERKTPRPMTMDDVVMSLERNHPRVPRAALERVAPCFVRRGDDGLFRWRGDPRHRDPSPIPFNLETFLAHARAITASTLFVSGGASGWHPTDEALRIAALRDVRTVTFEDAGHMIHWTRPGELASAIASFFAES